MKKSKSSFFDSKISILIVLLIFWTLKSVQGQFYNIYPATEIVPNSLPLNSSTIQLAAFLALTALEGQVKISRTSLDIICIECQKHYINTDSGLLPDMKIDVLYYDTSVMNTSTASIAALEYSLTSNHIAIFGNISLKERK